MFPDDDVKLRGAGRTTTPKPIGGHGRGVPPRSPERHGGRLAVVVPSGQRGTLYDSFELNAMVVRLNRLLTNGDGAGGSGGGRARRPRTAAGAWLAAPRALLRKIRGAFLGGRRGDG